MTSGYYFAIFPFCGGGKEKDDKKTKAFYDWATIGIPVTTCILSRISYTEGKVQIGNNQSRNLL